MSFAFEISDMDVQNVLIHRFHFQGNDGSKSRAVELMDDLDEHKIERAALSGGELDAQTDLALDEITEQLLAVFAVNAVEEILTANSARFATPSSMGFRDQAEELANDIDMDPLKALLKNAASVPFTPALATAIHLQLVKLGVLHPSDFQSVV